MLSCILFREILNFFRVDFIRRFFLFFKVLLLFRIENAVGLNGQDFSFV